MAGIIGCVSGPAYGFLVALLTVCCALALTILWKLENLK